MVVESKIALMRLFLPGALQVRLLQKPSGLLPLKSKTPVRTCTPYNVAHDIPATIAATGIDGPNLFDSFIFCPDPLNPLTEEIKKKSGY